MTKQKPSSITSTCLLCGSDRTSHHVDAHGRPHLDCDVCRLIFVPSSHHPDPATERERYETHNNDPDDHGYRAFLRRVAGPLLERLHPPARGLDYGCGPGPTLSLMMEERGHDVSIYDPFFAPNPDTLRDTYDFVTCTETAEHFHDPAAEFDRLADLLRPGGILAIMTQWADGKNFKRWRYARDETHVVFYRRATMQWIANKFGWDLEMPRRNVALFRRAG